MKSIGEQSWYLSNFLSIILITILLFAFEFDFLVSSEFILLVKNSVSKMSIQYIFSPCCCPGAEMEFFPYFFSYPFLALPFLTFSFPLLSFTFFPFASFFHFSYFFSLFISLPSIPCSDLLFFLIISSSTLFLIFFLFYLLSSPIFHLSIPFRIISLSATSHPSYFFSL